MNADHSRHQGNSRDFAVTTKRVLTRRGVIWLGQTCNLRCHFCYFQTRIQAKDHPEHPFMSLSKAKTICSVMAETYENRAVDIQGGEPTIYPQIHELVRHCRDMGLLPTLITNALVLSEAKACAKLKEAGLRDLLVSLHGLGATYDRAVGVPGASARQMAALGNLADLGIPWRSNTVLAKSVLPDLPAIARLAIERGARAVNFIAFNPFEDQQTNQRSGADVPRYGEVAGPLADALDTLIAAGVECNVRYFPLCMLPGRHRPHIYNFQQLPYDLHEWDYASWSWTAESSQRRRDGDPSPLMTLRQANRRARMFKDIPGYLEDKEIGREEEYRHSALIRAREHCAYRYSEQCAVCAAREICDGFHGDYATLFDMGEAEPIAAEQTIGDPRHFILHQPKIVEREDWEWAL